MVVPTAIALTLGPADLFSQLRTLPGRRAAALRGKASPGLMWPQTAAELRSAWSGEGARPYTSVPKSHQLLLQIRFVGVVVEVDAQPEVLARILLFGKVNKLSGQWRERVRGGDTTPSGAIEGRLSVT